MTAIAAQSDLSGVQLLDVRGNDLSATITKVVYNTADRFFNMAAVERNVFTGLHGPLGTTGFGGRFVGLSDQDETYGASSGKRHRINISGPCVKKRTTGVAVSGATNGAQDEGKLVWMTDDNINGSFSLSWSVTARLVGRVYRYVSSGIAEVLLFTPQEVEAAYRELGWGYLLQDNSFWWKLGAVTLSGKSTGDLFTDLLTFGGAGTIEDFKLRVTTPTTDSDADITVNMELNSTNLTGGVITGGDTGDGTGVDGPGLMSRYGAEIRATKITAANSFVADDTLSVECVIANAYSDGAFDLFARFAA